jgi:hypothetical protein
MLLRQQLMQDLVQWHKKRRKVKYWVCQARACSRRAEPQNIWIHPTLCSHGKKPDHAATPAIDAGWHAVRYFPILILRTGFNTSSCRLFVSCEMCRERETEGVRLVGLVRFRSLLPFPTLCSHGKKPDHAATPAIDAGWHAVRYFPRERETEGVRLVGLVRFAQEWGIPFNHLLDLWVRPLKRQVTFCPKTS